MENREYTQKEIMEIYGWTASTISDFVNYAKLRGVEIEKTSKKNKPIIYNILNDDLIQLEWKIYPFDNYFEVAKEGYVRTTKGKKIVGKLIKSNGYVAVTNSQSKKTYRVHRMVLETYKPIENMNAMLVDHINGNRSYNHIDNLRWVTREENNELKNINRKDINDAIFFLIQKIGYEGTYKAIKNIIENKIF